MSPQGSPRNPLATPVRIGKLEVRNRLYRAPVLEGAGSTEDPAAEYAKHFVPNAKAGVGLIVQGNTIVRAEGRTSPGMSAIGQREDMLALRAMTDAVRREGAKIVVQLGHGGLFALEGWHRAFVARRTSLPLAPSAPPWWLRATHGPVHVPDEAEVGALVARFGQVAAWAQEAGYDGVQLAASNAKLLHQFLSPVYNRRRDRYGGDLAARTTILREIRDAIAGTCGPDFPVLLKYCAAESGPFAALSLEEGVAIAQIAEDAGFHAVTPAATGVLPDTGLCKGEFPAASFENPRLRRMLHEAAGSKLRLAVIEQGMKWSARRNPFTPVWNAPVVRAVKQAVRIPVFAVGGIRTPAEANDLLSRGDADLIGVGRPFYAEPDLPRRFLSGQATDTACESCNRCVVPQMLGLPGVCYNPPSQRRARELRASA